MGASDVELNLTSHIHPPRVTFDSVRYGSTFRAISWRAPASCLPMRRPQMRSALAFVEARLEYIVMHSRPPERLGNSVFVAMIGAQPGALRVVDDAASDLQAVDGIPRKGEMAFYTAPRGVRIRGKFSGWNADGSGSPSS